MMFNRVFGSSLPTFRRGEAKTTRLPAETLEIIKSYAGNSSQDVSNLCLAMLAFLNPLLVKLQKEHGLSEQEAIAYAFDAASTHQMQCLASFYETIKGALESEIFGATTSFGTGLENVKSFEASSEYADDDNTMSATDPAVVEENVYSEDDLMGLSFGDDFDLPLSVEV